MTRTQLQYDKSMAFHRIADNLGLNVLNKSTVSGFFMMPSSDKKLGFFQMSSFYSNPASSDAIMQTILDCITEHFNIVKKNSQGFDFLRKVYVVHGYK